MAEIFPSRNLPGRAEAWGRAVEGEITSLERSVSSRAQNSENSARFSSGQLAVQADSLLEINARSAEVRRLPDISVTGSAESEPYPRTNVTVTFPADPKARNALLTLSGVATTSRSDLERLYVYALYEGQVVAGGWAQPYSFTTVPTEWVGIQPISIFGPIQTRPGVATQITVRIVRTADVFSPGSSTMTLQEPVLTLQKSGSL